MELLDNPLALTTPGRCRYCKCTDAMACDEGCAWADRQHTVCDSRDCLARWAGALIAYTKRLNKSAADAIANAIAKSQGL